MSPPIETVILVCSCSQIFSSTYSRFNIVSVPPTPSPSPPLDDVVTEQAILKWYNDAHVAKGKRVFLSQMKKMVDWLMTAEEESDTEEAV